MLDDTNVKEVTKISKGDTIKIQGVMKLSEKPLAPGIVNFESRHDDTTEVYRVVAVKESEWIELGRATTITVTIVPGDELNETVV